MNKIVVGIGEVLWDMLPEGRQLGGAPANFAYIVGQLGFDSRIVSAVGHDALGDAIAEELTARMGHCSKIATVDQPTGQVDVILDSNGIPSYNIRTDVAWDCLPASPALDYLAGKCSAVCFGSLAQRSSTSRHSILRFLDTTPPDCLKIFDANLRQNFYSEDILRSSMHRCNILKINDEELRTIAQLFNYEPQAPETLCRRLMADFDIATLILTCGERGSSVFTQSATSTLPTPKVEVADTVGAGDAFTAAYTAAILRGESTREAHQFAVDLAAHVCTQSGAMPALPQELKIK